MFNLKPLIHSPTSADAIAYLHDIVAQINKVQGYELAWMSHEIVEGEVRHHLHLVPQSQTLQASLVDG